MPAVDDANSISGALDKMVKFEALLVSPQVFGQNTRMVDLMVNPDM
jgi:hypothetical protein